MFENLVGSKVIDFEAYGTDEYDFPLAYNCVFAESITFDVGEYGYVKISFSDGILYFSTDGVSEEPPSRKSATPIESSHLRKVRSFYIGKHIEFIEQKENTTFLKFFDYPLLECYLDINDGHCDRNYLCIEIENWAQYC